MGNKMNERDAVYYECGILKGRLEAQMGRYVVEYNTAYHCLNRCKDYLKGISIIGIFTFIIISICILNLYNTHEHITRSQIIFSGILLGIMGLCTLISYLKVRKYKKVCDNALNKYYRYRDEYMDYVENSVA